MTRRPAYNRLKRAVLETLADGEFQTVGEIWASSGMRGPLRAFYSYLLHLRRWNLLLRDRQQGSRVHYRISERGSERLAWLRKQG